MIKDSKHTVFIWLVSHSSDTKATFTNRFNLEDAFVRLSESLRNCIELYKFTASSKLFLRNIHYKVKKVVSTCQIYNLIISNFLEV